METPKTVIKVFGPTPPCMRCKAAEKVAREVAKELGNVEVLKMDALSKEADKYNIMLTPAVVVNEKVICMGKVPTREDILKAVRGE